MMKHRIITLVFTLIMCLTVVPATALAVSEQEPNNDYKTATAIEPNSTVNASFTNTYSGSSVSSDYDWYQLSLNQPSSLKLSFEKPSSCILFVELYGVGSSSELNLMYNRTYLRIENPVNDYVSQVCDTLYLSSGDYYIKVYASMSRAQQETHSDYTMTALSTAYPTAGSIELEPNNEYAESTVIQQNRRISASFTNTYKATSTASDYDWYKLTLNQPGTFQLIIERPALSLLLIEIYSVDSSGALSQIYKKSLNSVYNSVEDYITDSCDSLHVSEGDYYIKLSANIGREIQSDYSFIVSDPSNMPSSWAAAEIEAAIASGIVPSNLQENYTRPVSRGNVAQMFINLIEESTGQSIEDFLATKGVSINQNAFTDTTDDAVLAAHALGIINGVGNGRFDPNGTFTRAQIAAIINRIAHVLDVDTEGFDHSFSDLSGHWADTELGWPVHAGIISGVGDNRFDPDGQLTTEQAIVITYRALQYFQR